MSRLPKFYAIFVGIIWSCTILPVSAETVEDWLPAFMCSNGKISGVQKTYANSIGYQGTNLYCSIPRVYPRSLEHLKSATLNLQSYSRNESYNTSARICARWHGKNPFGYYPDNEEICTHQKSPSDLYISSTGAASIFFNEEDLTPLKNLSNPSGYYLYIKASLPNSTLIGSIIEWNLPSDPSEPIAYAVISPDGNIEGDRYPDNLKASWHDGYDRYEITIPGEHYFSKRGYVTVVTPTGAPPREPEVVIPQTSSVDGKLLVFFYTLDEMRVKRQFHVVVFKHTQ